MINEKVIKDLEAIRLRPRNRGTYIWEQFMRKYNCEIICEVGICKGVNFREMIKHNPAVAVAIDCWIDDGAISRNEGKNPQEVLDKQYEEFKKSVADKSFVKIFREYSFDAAKKFRDNYFDVVYIDGDHSYEGCLRDICDWYPKVKKGKFLLGDDFRTYEGRRPGISFGIIEAVRDFAEKNSLEFFELPSFGWGFIKE